jgi:hypothetical protein
MSKRFIPSFVAVPDEYKFLAEFQSQINAKITYKIFEDFNKLNYVIGFWKNKKRVQVLEQDNVYSIPEHGLDVAKEMAESTIKEYIT